jgi:DNA polymerase-3 subunit epsilon
MKILVIDIETTAFTPKKGNIVEIGVASLDTETGASEILFDSLCLEKTFGQDPEKEKKAWIFENSDMQYEDVLKDMQYEDVLKALPFEDVKKELQELIDIFPDGITAFNNRFDFSFLEDRGIDLGKKLKCPMLLATDVCKLPGKFGKYKWPKVEEAYHHFFPDSKYIESHRAADDAIHEAAIVYELIKLGIEF